MDVPQNFAVNNSLGRGVSVSLHGEFDYFVDTEKQEDFFFWFFFSFFFFWLHPVAYGILVPWPGIEDFLIGNDGTACYLKDTVLYSILFKYFPLELEL